ncbi:MAG: aminoacyl-tRNA hydrolase [Spirochaetales bacterium]|nr:aminoacyl-tRNA hydrolase [Spirochaetales bacterium]
MTDYKLIVFLGNPGKKYEKTRHNAAWRLADYRERSWQKKFNGLWCKEGIGKDQKILLKPQTMMNLSGDSVRKAMDFFKLTPREVLVVHDELELPFGEVQLRFGGGLAGHNGLKSVKQQLGTGDFGRLRMGIGRPPYGDVQRWVLSPFAPIEEAELEDILRQAEGQILC